MIPMIVRLSLHQLKAPIFSPVFLNYENASFKIIFMLFQIDRAIIPRIIKIILYKIMGQRFSYRKISRRILGIVFEVFPIIVPAPVSIIIKASWNICPC